MIIKAQKQQTKSMNSSMVDFKSTVARRRRYSTVVAAAHNVVKSILNCNAYFEVFSQHISQLGIRKYYFSVQNGSKSERISPYCVPAPYKRYGWLKY